MTSLLDDLVTFARIEVESHDVEPWAEVLREVDLPDTEARLWLVSLYNTFDDLGSAWRFYERWPSPEVWRESGAITSARAAWIAGLWCSQERRGLRGGRVIRRIDSYVDILGGGTQEAWLTRWTRSATGEWGEPGINFFATTELLRRVWGVGRQSAFEWAEFLAKSCGFPLVAGDAQLWESSGPRKSLEMLYGETVNAVELSVVARECRADLTAMGVPLSWENFETVLCDFRVMTKGRYYPGQHLASLRAEIDSLYPEQGPLEAAWARVVPEPWCDVAAGIDKTKRTEYARTGRIIDTP